MERVEFALGEKKYVTIRVQSCGQKAFEVSQAKYILKKGEEIEESGTCMIEQEKEDRVLLSALIQPKAKYTVYTLEFTYEIPPEILKHEIRIGVK